MLTWWGRGAESMNRRCRIGAGRDLRLKTLVTPLAPPPPRLKQGTLHNASSQRPSRAGALRRSIHSTPRWLVRTQHHWE